MIVFCTVLKRGTMRNGVEYRPEHVNALYDQVKRFYKGDFAFLCFTDFPSNEFHCTVTALQQNWPLWWSKVEVFSLDVSQPGFYLDLDTVIVGDITNLVNTVTQKQFVALDEINIRGERTGNLGSGIMAWREWPSYLFRVFKERSEHFMNVCSLKGDQQFIERSLLSPWDYLQDVGGFPGGVYSYKFNLPDKDNLPVDAKIVYFHGTPKPWQVSHSWIPDYTKFKRI